MLSELVDLWRERTFAPRKTRLRVGATTGLVGNFQVQEARRAFLGLKSLRSCHEVTESHKRSHFGRWLGSIFPVLLNHSIVMNCPTESLLTVEVVSVDGCMVELATSFNSESWSARATAYTQFHDIYGFSSRLSDFSRSRKGEASFIAGKEDSSIGFLSFRFYPIGRTGHFACHLILGTRAATEFRPEELWKVSVELSIDAPALDEFVLGLQGISATESGVAILRLGNYTAH